MPETKITINNEGLSLEACLELPETPGPYPGVVLCHPHPLYGGDMDNNVVVAVKKALVKEQIACLRFNFRGVGLSQGSFANGMGEQDDAGAAISLLKCQEEIDADRVGIMGYSFGGMVALSKGSHSSNIRALAAVSPVVPANVAAGCEKPKLIICGDKDNMIPSSDILQAAEKMNDPKVVEVISGADHFWRGYESRLAGMVVDFFRKFLL